MEWRKVARWSVLAVIVVVLIVAAIVQTKHAETKSVLQGYKNEAIHLEIEKTSRDLTPAETAKLAELRHRIAVMELDGVGK